MQVIVKNIYFGCAIGVVNHDIIINKDGTDYHFIIIYNEGSQRLFSLGVPADFIGRVNCTTDNFISFKGAVDFAKKLVANHDKFNFDALDLYVKSLTNNKGEINTVGASKQWVLAYPLGNKYHNYIGKILFGSKDWSLTKCKKLCKEALLAWDIIENA